jgi:hypothetical protein
MLSTVTHTPTMVAEVGRMCEDSPPLRRSAKSGSA